MRNIVSESQAFEQFDKWTSENEKTKCLYNYR
jgi:hypothetical protein